MRLPLVFALCALLAKAAWAGPQCVHRDAHGGVVHDLALDGAGLHFCTTEGCWTFDPKTAAIAIAPRSRTTPAESGASVDGAQASFCKDRQCKRFALAFPYRVADTHVATNAARTLGAVVATPEGYESPDAPKSTVFLFDLARGKQVATLEGEEVAIFDHAFAIDHATLYTAAGKKLAPLAVADRGLADAGDAVLLTDEAHDTLIIQELATGKVRNHLVLGTPKNAAFQLVVAPDHRTAYAIGAVADEGEVVVIDLVAAKIRARVSPPLCF